MQAMQLLAEQELLSEAAGQKITIIASNVFGFLTSALGLSSLVSGAALLLLWHIWEMMFPRRFKELCVKARQYHLLYYSATIWVRTARQSG